MGFDKSYLPPGYKFQPTDKILIEKYLIPKVKNQLDMESVWYIFDKNIYQYENPLVLFQKIQKNQAYFFTPTTKVTSSGKNVKRTAGQGTWHLEDKGKLIKDDDNNDIGKNKMFTFDWNVPKEKMSEVKREKGHWIMHEYSLLPEYYTNNNIIKTDPEYVLCEIRCKIPMFPEQQQQQQSQPAVDAARPHKRQHMINEQPCVPPASTPMLSPSMPNFEDPIDAGHQYFMNVIDFDDVVPAPDGSSNDVQEEEDDWGEFACSLDAQLEGSNDDVGDVSNSEPVMMTSELGEDISVAQDHNQEDKSMLINSVILCCQFDESFGVDDLDQAM